MQKKNKINIFRILTLLFFLFILFSLNISANVIIYPGTEFYYGGVSPGHINMTFSNHDGINVSYIEFDTDKNYIVFQDINFTIDAVNDIDINISQLNSSSNLSKHASVLRFNATCSGGLVNFSYVGHNAMYNFYVDNVLNQTFSTMINNFTWEFDSWSEHEFEIELEGYLPSLNCSSLSSLYNTTDSSLNLTWGAGEAVSKYVVVRRNDTYATTHNDTEGYIVYNNTGFFFEDVSVQSTRYYTLFGYNHTGFWSDPCFFTWGAIAVDCFNESNPSQNLTFDLFITNENGSKTYIAHDCVNTFLVNIENIPIGNKTVLQIDSDGYEVRYYYLDTEENHYYYIRSFLPKSESESGGDDVPDTPQLFAHTDSTSVTNPLVNQVITMDHDPQDVIGVYKYTITSDTREYHETTKSVVDHTTYEIVTLGFTATEIVEVSVYNTSISYWVPISSDNYTANSTHVNVSADVLDDNTTIIKVGYYGEGNIYYDWILIPEDKYTIAGTTCTITPSGIDNDTALVKIDYYYYGLPPDAEYGVLYVLYVKDYYGDPVEDAKMIFKRYINTTDSFEEVSSLYTDANGQVNIYLIPHEIYKIFISKTYYQTEISDFTPDPEDRARTFRLEEQEIETERDEDVYYGITWTIEPDSHYQHSNFTIYFNITSSNNALDWYRMIVYKYNTSTGAWDQLSTQTDTTASGGSLSYTIQNINISNMTGKYKIECWYKKDGFDSLEVTQTGSSIFYVEYGGLRTSPVWNYVPDWVFLLVVVIIMALVMAFILPVAGVGTGYVGIGIFAFAMILKPDLTTGAGVSGWTILFITALVYTIALYIWSRI